MTFITWTCLRCVQELATILGPQNPTQRSCGHVTERDIQNLLYQQEHFWIPALAFCCKFLSLVFRVEQLSIKFSLCVELLQLQCSFIDFARTAAAQTGQSSRPWAPCHAPPLTAPSSWSRLRSLLLLPFFSSSSGPAGCGQGPRRKHATVTNTHWVMQQANCSFV